LGLDARNVTPGLTRVTVELAAEVRSFERASLVMQRTLGVELSTSSIRRMTQQVGGELAEQQEDDQRRDGKEVLVPEMAVVSCDGGRLRARQPGQGRGVKLSGDTGWRETKNASFEKMLPPAHPRPGADPCPRLPGTFRSAKTVANIAEKPAPNVPHADAEHADTAVYQGPERTLRTVLSSMASSEKFGPMMQREAARRRFYESPQRAFLGDGLAWNWTIWKKHFPTFVPILDFIHAIQYLYRAALALGDDEPAGWSLYVRHVTLCWEGRIDEVIAELSEACRRRNVDPAASLPDDDRLKPVTDAVRYFGNNRERMHYPEYRRQGLPVTSAPMESLIKQMGARVKGTEMFWDDPQGAEAILHVRAAALCDDGRLDHYLRHRPGCPFVRRSTTPHLAT
jgi:hypothetical protein